MLGSGIGRAASANFFLRRGAALSQRYTVLDCHCAGEPARVVLSGLENAVTIRAQKRDISERDKRMARDGVNKNVPHSIEESEGRGERKCPVTAAEWREELMHHHDSVRRLMLLEPRGYPCQNVNFVFPSAREDCDFGFVIAEQGEVWPMMSGHNIMCVATALLETGLVGAAAYDNQGEEYDDNDNENDDDDNRGEERDSVGTDTTLVSAALNTAEFNLESPAGVIRIRATLGDNGRAESIALRNAPSFYHSTVTVDVPSIGPVHGVDIAFGGMWYAIVDAAAVGLDLIPSRGREIARLGEMIKVATREQYPVDHPEYHYPGPDILAFTSMSHNHASHPATEQGHPSRSPSASSSSSSHSRSPLPPPLHARNAVVMSNGTLAWNDEATWMAMLDRSPCGTGTSAIMAVRYAKGELTLGQEFVHESVIGTKFHGRLLGKGPSIGKFESVIPEVRGQAWVTGLSQIILEETDEVEPYTVADIWSSGS